MPKQILFKRTALLLSIVALTRLSSVAQAHDNPLVVAPEAQVEGRWDIIITDEAGKEYPSWLEINHSGSKWLVGSYVGIVGSARPISRIKFDNGKISFTIPPQWEQETNDVSFEATLADEKLTGTVIGANGKTSNWTGTKAPDLRRATAPVWGAPIKLFNGKNLEGWHTNGDNQWVVEPGGILHSPKSGSNLLSDKKFNDFKLHIEFRCPKGSNSGVYLRGRYEVQVEDSKGKEPKKDLMGAIYGFLTPTVMAAKDAGEWQTYDITLIGRNVSIVANGKQIICSQDIPGITGGALDSKEGEPGPLYIQGDHGPIEYRNIVITPAK